MQKQLDILLKKYAPSCAAEWVNDECVKADGKCLPLLPWRYQRRFTEMRGLVTEGALEGISVMRTLRIVHKGDDLSAQLYRELDLCQFILNSKICEIFAIGDGKQAINVIAKTADGYICTLEMAATLGADAAYIDKHEIIAAGGVACDRAVDTQVPQSSVYVFGKDGDTAYTDVDAELYGLDAEQAAAVRAAFDTARNGIDLSEEVRGLKALLSAVEKSLATTENILVEG